jgi:hypothetical protein
VSGQSTIGKVTNHNQEDLMATKDTTTTDAAVASATDLAAREADAVTHDRATTPVGAGRITFKGHNAKAGYPFRVYEGQVEALVDGEWVPAEDAQAL